MRVVVRWTARAVVATALLGSALSAVVADSPDHDLSWSTFDGGGVMFSTGGAFELSGTIGQPDAGAMSGGNLTLTGGFWFSSPARGDCNQDGDIDLLDFHDLRSCVAGPNGGPVTPECTCSDFDGDDDVDLMDVGNFQRSFTGQ